MSADSSNDQLRAPPDRLLKSTSVVAAMTLLSRVTGLAREIAFATLFGSGPIMDAFAVAFRIPNLLRRFFGEGAFSQAFVPVIAEYRATRSVAETRELVDRITGTLGLVLFAITLIGVIGAPLLILAFAPGFFNDESRYSTAIHMLRLTFPYVLLVSLTALAGSILNAYRRFAVASFTPVILNVVMIGFAIWVEPRTPWPGVGLAAGVFVAGVLQLVFQVPFLRRLKLLPRPRWDRAHAGVRRIFALMLPAMIGSSVAQISILLDTLVASFLLAGSISWLYYSDRLIEFPLGVLGVAIGTVILPRLSEQHSFASPERFSATLDWALRLVLVIALPAAVGIELLADPLLATLFNHGDFTERDVAMSAASVRAYAPGLVGFILVKVLAPGYFARQDTRTPVRIGIQALILSMTLNVAFVLLLLRTQWAPAHAGIAAATACSGLFNAVFLFAGLRKHGVYRARPGWRPLWTQMLAGNAVMAAALLVVLHAIGDWSALGKLDRAGALALLVGGGAAVYFGVAWLLGLRPSALRARAT
ncbi:MAG TPA: murein biosynthesis integral membrane protein MurJ [Gammaproteobacteria bacterium]|nr:murein biosynthesis integral membrane protein MurJ [Gammaproteobacteria bacterium]